MQEFLLLSFGSLFLPLLIFTWYNRQTHLVYQGEVQVSSIGLLPAFRSSVVAYDFVSVFLPDKTSIIVEVSKERLAKFEQMRVPVGKGYANISRGLLGTPYVSALQLPGEESMQVDKRDSGLYLSVAYLLLGMLSFTWLFNPVVQSDVGKLAALLPAMLFVVSGYALGRFKLPSIGADSSSHFLGFIPMGSGKTGIATMSVLALAITAASFYCGGLLFLLGMNTAVAFGMMLALLAKPYAKS
jgi:hypothetical protein